MIGRFNILDWFGAMRTVFLTLTIVFLAGAVTIFIYAKIVIARWHREHEEHLAHKGHGADHPLGHDYGSSGQDQQQHHAPSGHESAPAGRASEWEGIVKKSQSIRDSDWKLSVIEADKLVDDVLKEMGYGGESMGERLMMIKPDELMHLQDLWDAHKLRNLIVHDTSYTITQDQVLTAIHSFEKVLKELGKV